MKRFLIPVAALTLLSACSSVAPIQGEEAVLIAKPMFFGHGGVLKEPVKTGREYVAWTTDHVMVNMQPVNWQVPFDDLMTKDGVPIDFEASVVVQVKDSVTLIEKFGEKWFVNNIDRPFRSAVRDSVRKYGMNEVAIDTNAISAIDTEVEAAIKKHIVDHKIPIEIVSLTVGKANPPDSIKNQRIETASEEQRASTEIKRTKAEENRRAAEGARAVADNAYRQAMGLSGEQFVELERIKMMNQVCAKGNCSFVIGDVKPLVSTR